jgi:plasmid maintenance system antidote protein VapI
MTRKLAPIHPGEILLEEFLSPLGMSQYRLAKESLIREAAVCIFIVDTGGFQHENASAKVGE